MHSKKEKEKTIVKWLLTIWPCLLISKASFYLMHWDSFPIKKLASGISTFTMKHVRYKMDILYDMIFFKGLHVNYMVVWYTNEIYFALWIIWFLSLINHTIESIKIWCWFINLIVKIYSTKKFSLCTFDLFIFYNYAHWMLQYIKYIVLISVLKPGRVIDPVKALSHWVTSRISGLLIESNDFYGHCHLNREMNSLNITRSV